MVVNGKYRVKTNAKIGLSRLLDIVDYLVEQELAKKTKPGNA